MYKGYQKRIIQQLRGMFGFDIVVKVLPEEHMWISGNIFPYILPFNKPLWFSRQQNYLIEYNSHKFWFVSGMFFLRFQAPYRCMHLEQNFKCLRFNIHFICIQAFSLSFTINSSRRQYIPLSFINFYRFCPLPTNKYVRQIKINIRRILTTNQ